MIAICANKAGSVVFLWEEKEAKRFIHTLSALSAGKGSTCR